MRVTVTPRCISGERIISRHVRVNNFDPLLRDEASQLVRAGDVERVAQRQRLDSFAIEFQVSDQRRLRAQNGVDVVSAREERVCEISNVTLAAAERCC